MLMLIMYVIVYVNFQGMKDTQWSLYKGWTRTRLGSFPDSFSCLSMILWYFNFSFAFYKNYFSIPDPTLVPTDFTGM